MITLYFHLQPQFKYELFHILHITIRLASNDDTEACDSIFQIGHVLGQNVVQWGFDRKSSKMSLWYVASKCRSDGKHSKTN